MSLRRLNQPRQAEVVVDSATGRPARVRWQSHSSPAGTLRTAAVEHVLEAWYVDDAWWTDSPVRRMYYECQLTEGTRIVLVYDLLTAAWYVQR